MSTLLSNTRPPGFLFYMVLNILYISTSSSCPDRCICPASSSQVSCDGADYTDIPRGIPLSISTLDFSNNHITLLSQNSLTQFRDVVNLNLKNNGIIRIHDGAFNPMINLQTLDLSGNKLTAITEYSLQGPEQLLHLDLSSNNLTTVEGAFAHMTQLSRLELSNNNITRITEFTFRHLTSLRYLFLSNNQITQIDRKAFRNLEKLMYLVLKGNPIGDVQKYQFDSLYLSYVDMSECGLRGIPRGLPNSIRYLQLRRNNLTHLHRHSFQDCPYVSILVLDENGLQDIQDRTFERMSYLTQLWLGNNQLKRIPQPLPNSLKRILMDSNLLNNVTNVFPRRSELDTLSLMGNNISYVSHDALSRLPLLKSLDLSNNKIKHIYGHTFINNTQLRTVQLSKNPLQYFHSRCFHGLVNVRTLSLAYINTQVSMYWDIFEDVVKLTQLDLDSSPYIVMSILASEQLLAGLESVEDLSMKSSDLTTLRSDFPDRFSSLLVLHLSSARWHCDTRLIWLRRWLITTTVDIENKDDIRCFTPRKLHGQALTEIAEADYAPPLADAPTMYPTAPLTTFTTMLQKSSTTSKPVFIPVEEETSDENDSYEVKDPYDPDKDLFPIIPELDFKTEILQTTTTSPSTPSEISWEEILSRSSPKSTLGPSGEKKYVVQNDNLSLHTKPTSDFLKPNPTKNSEEPSGQPMMLIIIATSLVTLVIAAALIATIIYFSRKGDKRGGCASSRSSNRSGSPSKRSSNGSSMYANGIKYKQRNDVLYFMPGSGEDSTSDSIQTNGSTKEANMSLVPGRDINHEGPLRCYKWEDF